VGRVFEVEARLVAVREALKGDEEGVDRDVAVHAPVLGEGHEGGGGRGVRDLLGFKAGDY
jgi:hypothetical protein